MLQKIIDFFRSLFGGGSKPKTPTPPTTRKEPEDQFSQIDPEEPQDGSEIRPDSVVVTHPVEEPLIVDTPVVEKEEEPEKTETTPPAEEEPPVVINTPEEEATENEPVAASHQARFLWCLDNGHGSKTAGKRSPKLSDGRQFLEYEFNRDVVKRIITALDELGVKTFNVVPEVDTDNFLEGRVGRANKKQSDLPKLFVSVHSNAAPAPPGKWSSPIINGIETWFFHNSRKGRKLAAVFQKHLIAKTGWKDRMTKSQSKRQFYVLRNTNMTAVLTENGFYNNKAQCLDLLKDSVRQKIADAHVDAIMEVEKNGIV